MPLFQYVKRIQEIANVRRCLLSCPYQILTRAPQMPNQVSALTTALISKAKPEPAPYEIRDTKMKGLVLRVQPSGHKSLNYEYRVKGRKKRTSLGSATILTLNQARALAIELQNSANTGIDVNQQAKLARASTLGAYITHYYIPYAEKNILSAADIIARLQRNFGHLYDTAISEINSTDIEHWRAGKICKFQTIRKEFSYLRAIINLAIKKDRIIDAHLLTTYQLEPSLQDSRDLAEKRLRYLSQNEAARLRQALIERETNIRAERTSANGWRYERGRELLPTLPPGTYADHIQPIVLIALLTGLRQGDIFDLRWSEVNLNRNQISKVINKTRRKNPNPTTLGVCKEAIEVLRKWHLASTGSDLVFPSTVTGNRYDNIDKAFRAVLKAAQIENFRFHDLRHTFASWLALGGVDLYTIQRLMTHSDIKMTQRYAHLSPDHMRDALDRVFG
jgi:integrase